MRTLAFVVAALCVSSSVEAQFRDTPRCRIFIVGGYSQIPSEGGHLSPRPLLLQSRSRFFEDLGACNDAPTVDQVSDGVFHTTGWYDVTVTNIYSAIGGADWVIDVTAPSNTSAGERRGRVDVRLQGGLFLEQIFLVQLMWGRLLIESVSSGQPSCGAGALSNCTIPPSTCNGKNKDSDVCRSFELIDKAQLIGKAQTCGGTNGGSDKPPSKILLRVRCVDNNNSPAFCEKEPELTLRAPVSTNGRVAGGHLHLGSRPLGRLERKQATAYWVTYEYTASEIAGQVDFHAEVCGQTCKVADSTMMVGVSDFVRLVNGAGYMVDPHASDSHPNFGDAVHSTIARPLATIGLEFKRLYEVVGWVPGLEPRAPLVRFTGLNLLYGGLFDIDRDFAPEHCGHRDGLTVDVGVKRDVDLVPLSTLEKWILEHVIKANGFSFPIPTKERPESPGDHWHIQYGR